MARLKKPLVTAVGIYLLLALVMFGCQRSFLYFPSQTPLQPGQGGTKIVTLSSEDGLELAHLYRPSRMPDGPVVVVFHGNAGHAGHRVWKFRPLLDAGFGVFFAEYRGYGGNPGEPDEAGLTADARAVMAFFESQGIDPGRLLLCGESLGTGVAVKMAAEYAIAGLILEAPFTSIADVAQAHYWYLPARWLVLDTWDSASRIGAVRAPVLIVQGEADRVIPPRFGKEMFALAPEPKAALFQPGAGHNNLFDHPEVVARVIAFIREQVPGATSGRGAATSATQ